MVEFAVLQFWDRLYTVALASTRSQVVLSITIYYNTSITTYYNYYCFYLPNMHRGISMVHGTYCHSTNGMIHDINIIE